MMAKEATVQNRDALIRQGKAGLIVSSGMTLLRTAMNLPGIVHDHASWYNLIPGYPWPTSFDVVTAGIAICTAAGAAYSFLRPVIRPSC